jgi:hypothetical protein
MHSPPQSHYTLARRSASNHHHNSTEGRGGQIWSTEGRGGREKEEKEGEAHGRRLGNGYLHIEWKGEKEEKEGEAHRRRARRRRLEHIDLQRRTCRRSLGHTDLQRRRAHRFAEEEGTRFCTEGGHMVGRNGLTCFSYLLSVHANCFFFTKTVMDCINGVD